MPVKSLYSIPPSCICMGDGLMGMTCTAETHAVPIDFPKMVRDGHYEGLVTAKYVGKGEAWREQSDKATSQFLIDAKSYVIGAGVRRKYAGGVVGFAWQQGHADGYSEVLYFLQSLVEILTCR